MVAQGVTVVAEASKRLVAVGWLDLQWPIQSVHLWDALDAVTTVKSTQTRVADGWGWRLT